MPRKIPMRQCVGCGEMKEKKSLIRVIRTPDGTILLDRTGRANGRGAYLCDDPACLAAARKRSMPFSFMILATKRKWILSSDG